MPRPRKEEARDLHRLAIEATISLLEDRDRPELSMAEVARTIGCSAPALYAYFKDRDDLLDTVRRSVIESRNKEKAARYASPSEDPLKILAEGGHRYVGEARAHPALYRLIYCRADSVGTSEDAVTVPALSALTRGVRACQSHGYAIDWPAEPIAQMLWSMVHGAVLLALDSEDPRSPVAWGKAHRSVDSVIALIAATRSSATPKGAERTEPKELTEK